MFWARTLARPKASLRYARPGWPAPPVSARTSASGWSATTLFGRFLDLDDDGALLDSAIGGRAAAASPPARFSRLPATRPSAERRGPMLLAINANNTNTVVRDVGRRRAEGQLAHRHRRQAHRRRICRLARSSAGARRPVARADRRRGDRQRRARDQFQPASRSAANIAGPTRWWSATGSRCSAPGRWSIGRRRSAPTASSIPSRRTTATRGR